MNFIRSFLASVILLVAFFLTACGSDGTDITRAQDSTPLATIDVPAEPTVTPVQADAEASPEADSDTAQIPNEPPFFDGEDAYEFAELQLGFGHRPTGSPALERTRQAMIEILEEAGWEIMLQEFEHVAQGETFHAVNVIARRGEGQITIIGSHYDSRLVADNDPVASNRSEGVPGANDGASSTAVLLEMAGIIDEHYMLAEDQQIWLTFFDAEDNGRIAGWDWILGSRYMASNLDELGVDRNDIDFMLLLDMVGEADGQLFRWEANSLNSAPAQLGDIWDVADQLGYGEYFAKERRGPITDDHLPFIQIGIPAVDIIDLNYPYWHTVDDTLDKISAESLDRVGDVVEMYLIQTNRIRTME